MNVEKNPHRNILNKQIVDHSAFPGLDNSEKLIEHESNPHIYGVKNLSRFAQQHFSHVSN
jgi:hypothetical protein